MPEVTIHMVSGRTTEQKRGLVKDVAAAIVKNLSVKPEAVTINLIEYTRENKAKAGKLFSDAPPL
jgi:4-oxalocrotonate tautomerase